MINKVPFLRNSKPARDNGKLTDTQELLYLGRGPTKTLPLFPLTLRILCGIKTTFLILHFTEHIISNPHRYISIPYISGNQPNIKIEIQQLRLIIKHFFKMGHQPLVIHRVAVKTTRQMVMNPPLHHLITSQRHMG